MIKRVFVEDINGNIKTIINYVIKLTFAIFNQFFSHYS